MVLRSQRGYSLVELMMVIAIAGTLMAVGLPILTDLSEGTKLNAAVREVERELQSARLKSVTVNQTLRVRLNCPTDGYLRTVEYLGTAADSATNRCLESAYPFPVQDNDILTTPNYDGPVRLMPNGATVTTAAVEFRSDGTAYDVMSGVPLEIPDTLTITVTRNGKSKTVTVNGAGKIQLQ
jgi:prepilin-type N-terminal cleavage/methylation domain-containing protein